MERSDEEWRDTDYAGYQVSNYGRVRSININGKYTVLKPTITKNGYSLVCLKRAHNKTRSVHRLVAKAFIDNPNNFKTVNHINEDKQDNRPTNLEWCTQSYNSKYGLCSRKMGDTQSIPIICIFPDGRHYWFRNARIAAEQLECKECRIRLCLKNTKNNTKGYRFYYANDFKGI